MRLDRFVSQATGLSRRAVRELIRHGRVALGQRIVRDSAAPIGGESVRLDGELLQTPQALYLMLHKPLGVISATRDSHQATVLDLLPRDLARRVHPAGRLDKDTSGLLLLTDDGHWSHRLTSPRYRCPKVYRARLAAPLRADAELRLAAGLMLRGESGPTQAAALERLGEHEVRITVTEGRYHLVRRLIAALDNRVLSLHRERIGGLGIDPNLAPGDWRLLDDHERSRVLLDPGDVG